MDKVKIPFQGQWYEFAIYGTNNADDILREIFVEDVYQVGKGDVVDTGIVVDIGGNVGAFSVFVASLGATEIHTFEPDSLNYEVLERNIVTNGLEGVIRPHHVGVSDTEREAELVQGQGGSYVVGGDRPHGAASDTETVQLISLGTLFADNGIVNCDILKLDCEGSEYDIIRAAPSDVLAKARYITMEFHGTTLTRFGRMIAKLTATHNVHIIGSYDRGGQVYAKLY